MSWPVLPVVFEAESFSEAKQKKNIGWMRFCFPCWTPDEKVPASKQPVNRKCCGQIWAKPRIPPKPRTKLLKGCCSFTPGMDSTFQAVLLHGIAWNIILHHPEDILKVWMTAAPWTVSESILELRTWLPGASLRLSEETRENAWNMHDKQGKEIVLLCVSFARRGEHWCCTWCKDIVKMDHWKSLMTDVWWWRRWWRRLNMVSSQCLPCPFQVLQIYHNMELALCRGPVWQDILTGKWAHFQLGTGNEKKPRQTESKSKQIPMRPGWGSRLHRFEPNGGF